MKLIELDDQFFWTKRLPRREKLISITQVSKVQQKRYRGRYPPTYIFYVRLRSGKPTETFSYSDAFSAYTAREILHKAWQARLRERRRKVSYH